MKFRFIGYKEQEEIARRNAVLRLQEAIQHHDSFEPVPDDSPIFVEYQNCSYELLYDDSFCATCKGQFNLGDLRKVLELALAQVA